MEFPLAFLLGTAVVVVLVRLHFRNSPDVRTAVVSPAVFAVIGAQMAISLGMMWLWVDTTNLWDRRIDLDVGVSRACAGAVFGALIGQVVRAVFAGSPRARATGFVLTLTLLTTSDGAVLGWLVSGDLHDSSADSMTAEARRSTQLGMARGSVIGCSIGVGASLLELCFGSRRASRAVTPPETENVAS